MSCYDKHPDLPQIECWHSPDHAGDHNKEGRSWPNLKDPLRIEIARLTDEVERMRAERIEVLALLEAHRTTCDGSDDGDMDPPCLPCRTRALAAKLRGAP